METSLADGGWEASTDVCHLTWVVFIRFLSALFKMFIGIMSQSLVITSQIWLIFIPKPPINIIHIAVLLELMNIDIPNLVHSYKITTASTNQWMINSHATVAQSKCYVLCCRCSDCYFASGKSAEYCLTCLCVSVCPLAHHKNHTSKLHQIFCTCYLWPRLSCSSDGSAVHHVLLVLWLTLLSHYRANGQKQKRHVCFVQFAMWSHQLAVRQWTLFGRVCKVGGTRGEVYRLRLRLVLCASSV